MRHLHTRYVRDPKTGRRWAIPAGGSGEGDSGGGSEGSGEGGTAGAGSEGGAGQDGGQGGGDGQTPATFTQEEVNRIAAREKNEGRRAAETAIAEELGVPVEEAKTLLAEHRKREDEEKSEAQKAREAADAEKAEAEKAKAEAAQERHDARVERALLTAGVAPDRLDRARRSLALEVGADDDAIAEEVKALQADVPALFGSGNGSGTPSSHPPGKPPTPSVGSDAFKKGADRAKQYAGFGTVQDPNAQ